MDVIDTTNHSLRENPPGNISGFGRTWHIFYSELPLIFSFDFANVGYFSQRFVSNGNFGWFLGFVSRFQSLELLLGRCHYFVQESYELRALGGDSVTFAHFAIRQTSNYISSCIRREVEQKSEGRTERSPAFQTLIKIKSKLTFRGDSGLRKWEKMILWGKKIVNFDFMKIFQKGK
jgi:hypothetical protein